jgi:hypothetical protein
MVLVLGMTVGTIFSLFVLAALCSLIATQHRSNEPSAVPGEVEDEKFMLAGAET